MILTVCLGLSAITALYLAGPWALAYWSTHPYRIRTPIRPPTDLGPYIDATFVTSDGVRLSGWYLSNPRAKAVVVVCHGHQANRTQCLPIVRSLLQEGLNVLAFDFRRTGRSDGDISTIGYLERLDIIAAVDWIRAQPGSNNLSIGVFGHSMGGAAAILASAEDHRISAVASHGAYATLTRAIDQRGRFFLGLLGPILSVPAAAMGRRWLQVDPAMVAPSVVVGRIAPRPVLILHGSNDPLVCPEDARILYESAGEPRALHWLRHSYHLSVDQRDLSDFHQTLRSFFSRTLCHPNRSTRTR